MFDKNLGLHFSKSWTCLELISVVQIPLSKITVCEQLFPSHMKNAFKVIHSATVCMTFFQIKVRHHLFSLNIPKILKGRLSLNSFRLLTLKSKQRVYEQKVFANLSWETEYHHSHKSEVVKNWRNLEQILNLKST